MKKTPRGLRTQLFRVSINAHDSRVYLNVFSLSLLLLLLLLDIKPKKNGFQKEGQRTTTGGIKAERETIVVVVVVVIIIIMAEALSAEILSDCLSDTCAQTRDLAGFRLEWLPDLMAKLCATPIPAKDFVAIKFIVGAGKKLRSKYNEENLKVMTDNLRKLEFVEDRGASACKECQKTYKYQHDTDKDLKYLHVFPAVAIIEEEEKVEKNDVIDDETGRKTTPEMLCAKASVEEFEELVEYNVPSFSQKRALLKRLKAYKGIIDQCDEKLSKMESLTEEEQEMYDIVSEIENKINLVESQLEEMIREGRLTAGEQSVMVEELTGKLNELDVAKAKAEEERKEKRKEQIVKLEGTVKEKIDALKSKRPIVYTIEHAEELAELKAQVRKLKALENKSGLRTAAEVGRLAKLPGLIDRIEQIETEDKGWFEDECATLLFGEKNEPAVKEKNKATTNPPRGGGGGGGGGSGWISKAAGNNRKKVSSGSNAGVKKASNPFDLLGDE